MTTLLDHRELTWYLTSIIDKASSALIYQMRKAYIYVCVCVMCYGFIPPSTLKMIKYSSCLDCFVRYDGFCIMFCRKSRFGTIHELRNEY